MLWYCGYRALPQVRAADLARAFLRQQDAGTNHPTDLRGWYGFATGVGGFIIMEAATPVDLARILEPYSRLVRWEIEAVSELNYNQVLEELRRSAQRVAMEDSEAGLPPTVRGQATART